MVVADNLFSLVASCKLHGLDPESYLAEVIRVMPYWPRQRYLELETRYWAETRGRLDAGELARPLGHVTVPPPRTTEEQTNHGISMPGRSTLTELVNAVSNETRSLLLNRQVRQALADEVDDFDVMLQDSTAVEGNVAWPTHSRTMVALVARMLRVGAALGRVGLTAFDARPVQRLLAAMDTLDREIDLSTGGKKGKKV